LTLAAALQLLLASALPPPLIRPVQGGLAALPQPLVHPQQRGLHSALPQPLICLSLERPLRSWQLSS
jgi:hypothetical protein